LKANLSLEATLKQTSESDAVTQAEMEMQELETRRAEMESWKEEASELGKEESGLVSANQLLKAEGDKLNAQLEELSSSSDPICPLCGQDLSDEHRAELIASLETEREERRDLYAANASRIIELDKLVNERQTLINKTAPKLRRLDALRDLVARQSEKRIHEEEKNEELHQNQAVIQEIEGRLEAQDYAAEQREALNQTQAELDNLGYREGDIHEVRDAVERLVAFQDRKASLDAARKSLPDLESNLTRSSEQFAVWQTQLHADEEKYEALTLEVEELTQKVEGYEALQSRMSELSDEQGRAQAAFGAAKQKVNALDSQRERRDELLEEQRSIAEEKGIYEELRRAFGRDGIPAMIIEAAIPEIESEANEILSRMTDGRMHIRFDTQREKVTGGTRETLDITIADELGSRDYATFSGGEAFRVNFAIRLALSRMLARRAGAQLRTLIIDEGFGTQDTQGRERLVQAINAIKDEFDLILVITHIDELKDAFPARIEITKTPQGSVVELV
jgi:exonuclease SbcC